MSSSPLPTKLMAICDELYGTTTRLHRLVDTLDDWLWGRSPTVGKWSVARCIEHLNLTSLAYLSLFRAAFKDARAQGLLATNPSFRLDFRGWLIFKSVEPSFRFRMKTPDAFVPPTIEPKEKVVGEFDTLQRELVALLEEAADLDLGKITIVSPFNASLKYSAYSAFRLIPAHQRRHLGQAEQVLRTLTTQTR
jgi:DinB superfamily